MKRTKLWVRAAQAVDDVSCGEEERDKKESEGADRRRRPRDEDDDLRSCQNEPNATPYCSVYGLQVRGATENAEEAKRKRAPDERERENGESSPPLLLAPFSLKLTSRFAQSPQQAHAQPCRT